MKTYSIDMFLSTGIVIRLERLSKSKLKKLEDIIGLDQVRDCYHAFKHEGTRHYIRPNEISHYATKKVII